MPQIYYMGLVHPLPIKMKLQTIADKLRLPQKGPGFIFYFVDVEKFLLKHGIAIWDE